MFLFLPSTIIDSRYEKETKSMNKHANKTMCVRDRYLDIALFVQQCIG